MLAEQVGEAPVSERGESIALGRGDVGPAVEHGRVEHVSVGGRDIEVTGDDDISGW